MPFRDIAGHRPILALLGRAVSRGTLPPSLIFSGPDGVGKRTTALALAQALNCDQPAASAEGMDACGTCASCTRIARGVHADILIVEPGESGTIKIDQIREVIDRAGYRPFEGRRRLVVIDEADALISEAQNALLKTLEEPPPGSVFVLVTARPDLLLITVRSRGHRLRFGALSPADVAQVLMRAHGYSAAAAAAAAGGAEGSVARALSGDDREEGAVRSVAATVLRAAASSNDVRRRLESARALTTPSSDRDELIRRVRAMSSLVRDLGVLSASADESLLANPDLRAELEAWRRSFDPERTITAYAVIDRALNALDRNASPKIVADWLSLNL